MVYELQQLNVRTLLMIGLKDTTAIGKDAALEAIRPTLGKYAELGKRAVKAIPGAKLVEFPDMGHVPQMQDSDNFMPPY